MPGVGLLHVPYKGAGPAVIDTMSGQVHTTFTNTVISQAMNSPGVAKGLAANGSEVAPRMSSEEFKVKFERDWVALR